MGSYFYLLRENYEIENGNGIVIGYRICLVFYWIFDILWVFLGLKLILSMGVGLGVFKFFGDKEVRVGGVGYGVRLYWRFFWFLRFWMW